MKNEKTYICKYCGKSFTEKYSKWSNGDFCSKRCSRKYSNNTQKNKMVERYCTKCGKLCKVSCNTPISFVKCDECKNIKNIIKHSIKNIFHRFTKHCLCCGKEFVPHHKTSQFCSNECVIKYHHIQKMKQVKENNGIGCDWRQIKNYILETRGHKCEICGSETWMGKPIPLVLDHINGRASDDRLDNLRLVCCNCDAQLPTYKSKNKNSDRRKRKGVWI